MAWNDDSWKDSYDAWKLRSPYDDGPEEECWHEEYEIDWQGLAHCSNCNTHWCASADEIRLQREANERYDAHRRREARREFWRKLTLPIRWPIYRLLDRVWPRKACKVLTDDEIPF